MSDDLRAEIRSTVSAILRERDENTTFDGPLWKMLAETGFHLLGVPEEIGGSGGGIRDLAVVVDAVAFHAARVPVAESAFLAGWLLAQAGLTLPDGVVVASADEAGVAWSGGVARLSGRLQVPWGRHADHVVALARGGDAAMVVVLPSTARSGFEPGENIAGEPRDVLEFNDFAITGQAAVELDAAALWQRGALVRSVQLAAAARAVLESARRHVTEREQFGRPLARFQAVQQHLAALAAEVAAMRVSAEAAVLAVEESESDVATGGGEAAVAVAAAKATTSASAHVVASIGHQLHGALGYSREHHLGAATTRLWSWREEFGNEAYWQDQLAAAVGAASGEWWTLMTGGGGR
ncbi:acyl-CoA dehydrogenase family protein [Amycolatopsis sp. YIM 10]|uniref:acyl-CoA dehydrogenase family protein n=1 Tax=Amycolatopsis sp. YIM 10 TaxID=2653857 RepID=UPI001290740F|nr:acyl-CoA dehydrogenase family protein [Amycolatopsis sp. YIM 10]QFU92523.1 Acryloyl-CoA reductase (NADH) [Amycolatopsis sp. YIM 10]